MSDVFVIAKKELKAFCNKAFLSYFSLLILVSGVIFPWLNYSVIVETGHWQVSIAVMLFILQLIPYNLTSDSFAGEKERKTLETLLSTPISISAVFIGKFIAVMIVSSIVLITSFALNIATVNVQSFFDGRHIFMYNNFVVYIVFVNGLTIMSFITLCDILISMWSKTVRSSNLFAIFIGAPVLVPLILKLDTINFKFAMIYSIVILLIDIILILAMRIFFTRDAIMRRM